LIIITGTNIASGDATASGPALDKETLPDLVSVPLRNAVPKAVKIHDIVMLEDMGKIITSTRLVPC
jgi:hypothetical protein